jgi:hypothetical protein
MSCAINKWKKGYVVVIGDEPYVLTSKPKKAIDGSWVVFMTNTQGKVVMEYIREEQLDEIGANV